ncbi:hypothetical protein [Streptomyces sp. SID12488]|uniref:hypothetical protein n=1 Tax=Streptomyces sp. SID12488 TaxID=2706040 RepID=UPI0013D9AD54|nr:hypothetical protein [Streptomyces sp. SID12488]NEA62577.1 hypothetical protein [Streptomyces sp. SID12488]
MTTAVLKNRLLDITNRAFKETDYGARDIAAFVKAYPDLLALDSSTIPPKVRLIDTSLTDSKNAPAAIRGRIRPDLWRATMDYRSGNIYHWDGKQAIAVHPTAPSTDSTLPEMPTISSEDMDQWRHNFQETLPEQILIDEQESEQVAIWAARGLATNNLPIRTRNIWNEYLNNRVVKLLAEWFRDNSLPVPEDLVQHRNPIRSNAPVGVAQLRELILRCVRNMTEEELKAISLPPSAVLRAYGGGEAGLRIGLTKQVEL